MTYVLGSVRSKSELDKTYAFFKMIFSGNPVVDNPEYTLEKWDERMKSHGDLMFYASLDGQVVGIVFGRMNDNKSITIALVAVHEDHRGAGLARQMILLLEERAAHHGVSSITLGAVESAEGFYSKLGYTGSLLIQSQVHSIEQLLSLESGYEVGFTNIYDGKVSQVCLNLPQADRALQKEYEAVFPGCYTQMMYSKKL